MSNRSPARVLRVTGLPPEMAVGAVHTVLRAERSVRAIDVIEGALGDPASSSVFVVVDPEGLARVHHKIATGFAGIEIEDVTKLGASAYVAKMTRRPDAGFRSGEPTGQSRDRARPRASRNQRSD